MIECSFTFPAGTKQVRVMSSDLEGELVTCYGGFTRFGAYGGWCDDSGEAVMEPVFYFTVAVDSDTEARRLRRMVAGALRLAGERSMFWKVDYQSTISIEGLS